MTARPMSPAFRAAHAWSVSRSLRRAVGWTCTLLALVALLAWSHATPLVEDAQRERELAVAVEAALKSEQAREELAAAYSALLRERPVECAAIVVGSLADVERAARTLEAMR